MQLTRYKEKIHALFEAIRSFEATPTQKDAFVQQIQKERASYDYLCLFCMGRIGKSFCERLQKCGLKVDFFCDNDFAKIGSSHDGVPCISLESLQSKENALVVITSFAASHDSTLEDALRDKGIHTIISLDRQLAKQRNFALKLNVLTEAETSFCKLIELVEDDLSREVILARLEAQIADVSACNPLSFVNTEEEYFPKDIIRLTDEEVFVDGGAYDGDTVQLMLDQCNNQFKHLYSFELTHEIFEKLQQRVVQYEPLIKQRISIFEKGLYSSNQIVQHSEPNHGSSILTKDSAYIDPNAEMIYESEVISLDEILLDVGITYIKLDIEGAEIEALQGAKMIVQKCKPKLAICIYHKMDHFWVIPLLLKEWVPEYKLYIRHHSDAFTDTVCYATL